MLAICKSFYCLDLLVIYDFPAVMDWVTAPRYNIYITRILISLMILGGFLIVVAKVLTSGVERLGLTITSAFLIACGYAGIASISSYTNTKHYGFLTFLHICLCIAWLLYTITVGVISDVSKDDMRRFNAVYGLKTASMLLGVVVTIILMILSWSNLVSQMLSPGNFLFIAYFIGFCGFFCLFLSSLSQSLQRYEDCGIACKGTEEFGYMLTSVSTIMYGLFFAIVADVTDTGITSYHSKNALYEKYTVVNEVEMNQNTTLNGIETDDNITSEKLAALFHPDDEVNDSFGDAILLQEIIDVQQSMNENGNTTSEWYDVRDFRNNTNFQNALYDSIHAAPDDSTFDDNQYQPTPVTPLNSSVPLTAIPLPSSSSSSSSSSSTSSFSTTTPSKPLLLYCDVFVVGCGPVGLTLANEVGG